MSSSPGLGRSYHPQAKKLLEKLYVVIQVVYSGLHHITFERHNMYRGTATKDAPMTLKGKRAFVSEHAISGHGQRQHRGVLLSVTHEGDRATFVFDNGVFIADLKRDVMISPSPF